MNKFIFRSLVVAVVLAFVSSAAAQTIRLGVNLELSGRFATIGTTSLQGVEAALQLSGVDNIELSVCDNATTVEGSVACANRFVDEGVLAVLGPIASSHAIPAAEVLQQAGVIMISTASTNDATTQIGDHIFRMAYLDSVQGPALATMARERLDADTVIVFRQQDDDYSFGLAGFFVDAFEALGGTAIVVDFVANTVDYSAQINDILGEDADAMFFSAFCAEGVPLMTAVRAAGIDTVTFGADAVDDSQCPEGGGTAFDGFLFSGFASAEMMEGAAAERATEFGEFFFTAFPNASDFNGFTLAGADSLNVMVEAIQAAGSSDPAEVLAALQDIQGYPGVSGEVTFRGTDGSPAGRVIGFYEYQVPAPDGSEWTTEGLFSVSTSGE